MAETTRRRVVHPRPRSGQKLAGSIGARQQANRLRPATTRERLLLLGDALFDDEPIDGLDILSIEPHLIARTILDYHEDTEDIVLTREEFARMFEDFASISDEELDVLCSVRT